MSTRRNAPCPCGSGRKFKHCCLDKDRVVGSTKLDPGPGAALVWLQQRFGRQLPELIETGFFADIDPQSIADALSRSGADGGADVTRKIADYVLRDAIIERGDEEGRGVDWVLERGPRLSDEQRDYLERLAKAPLRLYDVVEARPGEGVSLRDEFDAERSPPLLCETSAQFKVGDMVGARVLRWPNHARLGDVVYPLDPEAAASVIARVTRELNGEFDEPEPLDPNDMGGPLDPEVEAIADQLEREYSEEDEAIDAAIAAQMEDEVVAKTIREAWLLRLLLGATLP